jgi:hypothetical protein
LEDVARVLELVTPAAPGLFLPLAASATFVRSAALTGRGSLINGTFMQHLGRNQNLGDVRAKLEVQGRWLALVALPVGIGIFRYVSSAFGMEDAAGGGGLAGNLARYSGTIGAYSTIVGGHAVCCWKAAQVRVCAPMLVTCRGRLVNSTSYIRSPEPLTPNLRLSAIP